MQHPSTSEDFVALPPTRERSSRSKTRPTVEPPPSSGDPGPSARQSLPVEPPAGRRDDRIASRAYDLFVQRGMTHGSDVDDWLEAERLVDGEEPGLIR